MTDDPLIVPLRRERRDPAPPPHDGPDDASAAPLDGATAARLAQRRRLAARRALGERSGAAAADRPVPSYAYDDADVDDEYL